MSRKSVGFALLAGALFGALALSGCRQDEARKASGHRVVFELTSDDPESWEGVLNNVTNTQNALGQVTIEVVVHGKGLGMLIATTAAGLEPRMRQASERGVIFAACENTMRKQSVRREQLVPYARTVDSGVAEVVRKQEAGWAYVRLAH